MRKPMVTRTFKITKVQALIANVTEGTTASKEIVVTGEFKDSKKLEKKLREIIDNEQEKFVFIQSKVEDELLYGMTEQEFIEKATVLDKETRKAIAEDAQETPAVAEDAQETPAVAEDAQETPAVAEDAQETPAVAEDTQETVSKKSKKRGN